MGRQIHYPYPEDAHLIDGLANEELNKLGSDSTSQRKVSRNGPANNVGLVIGSKGRVGEHSQPTHRQ